MAAPALEQGVEGVIEQAAAIALEAAAIGGDGGVAGEALHLRPGPAQVAEGGLSVAEGGGGPASAPGGPPAVLAVAAAGPASPSLGLSEGVRGGGGIRCQGDLPGEAGGEQGGEALSLGIRGLGGGEAAPSLWRVAPGEGGEGQVGLQVGDHALSAQGLGDL